MRTTADRTGPPGVRRAENPALRPIVIFAIVAFPSGRNLLGAPVALRLPVAPLFVGVHPALGLHDAGGSGGVGRVGCGILVIAVPHASLDVPSELVTADADWIGYVVTLALGVGALIAWRGSARGGAR